MTDLPGRVKMVEVAARDGLQNEHTPVPAAVRIELLDRLTAAGLSVIEAGSFVSPRRVPQMADTALVLQGIRRAPGASYPVLVPNEQGLEAALAAAADEVTVFGSASETFSFKNMHCSIAESLGRYARVTARARHHGLRVRGYVSCALGCPYEGEIAPAAAADIAAQLYELGCYEISLADTIGVGTPNKVRSTLEAVAARVPRQQLAVHFHDTYGQALANVVAALESGIAAIDSAVGGLGGCPYAPGASGNVSSEDVLYLLTGLGIETGVDLNKLIDCGNFICHYLGRPNGSKVAQAFLSRKTGE
jgi:hydroxymethylglutaryl-CoA lyase